MKNTLRRLSFASLYYFPLNLKHPPFLTPSSRFSTSLFLPENTTVQHVPDTFKLTSICSTYQFQSGFSIVKPFLYSFLKSLNPSAVYAVLPIIQYSTENGSNNAITISKQFMVTNNSNPRIIFDIIDSRLMALANQYGINYDTTIYFKVIQVSDTIPKSFKPSKHLRKRFPQIFSKFSIPTNYTKISFGSLFHSIPLNINSLRNDKSFLRHFIFREKPGALFSFNDIYNIWISYDSLNSLENSCTNFISLLDHSYSPIMSFKDTRFLNTNRLERHINEFILVYTNNIYRYFKRTFNFKFIENSNIALKINNRFVVFDLETYLDANKKHIPYAIGFYDGNQVNMYHKDDFKSSNEMIVQTFLKYLNEEYQNYTFYAHNMGHFDGILILKVLLGIPNIKIDPILKDGKLLSFTIEYDSMRFNFKDSLSLLPFSLSNLSKAFKVTNPKSYFPHLLLNEYNLSYSGTKPDIKYFPSITKEEYQNLPAIWNMKIELFKYLKNDLLSLHQCLKTFSQTVFNKYNINLTHVVSTSALAYKIFKTCYNTTGNIPIITGKVHKNIREAFFGGRVDVFKPYCDSKLNYYDVNSLYPAAMLKDMPVGNPVYYSVIENLNNFFGFVKCIVKAPDNIKIPLLPYRLQGGGNINPTGTWVGWYFSEELKHVLKYGYEITPLEGYEFERGKDVFKYYITENYEIKKVEEGTAKLLAKLLMNSLYGRFGMPEIKSTTAILNADELKNLLLIYNVKSIKPISKDLTIVNYYEVKDSSLSLEENKFHEGWSGRSIDERLYYEQSISIAACITAYSRMLMNDKLMLNPENVYYTDTDSIAISGTLPEEDVSKDELGKFKLEKIVTKALFIAPKLYLLLLDNNKLLIKARSIGQKMSYMDFEQLYEGVVVDKTVQRWFKDITKAEIVVKDINIKLKPNLHKRIKVYKDNQWVDTASHKVKGNFVLTSTDSRLKGSLNHAMIKYKP